MESATRSSWLSPALENAVMLGSSPAGTLSMQKKPISSSAFIATDFPAPESPLTINSSICVPHSLYLRSSADYADLFFQIVTGLFFYDGAHFLAQCQHVCAGCAAKVHHKAAVLLADGGTAVPVAPQTALVN